MLLEHVGLIVSKSRALKVFVLLHSGRGFQTLTLASKEFCPVSNAGLWELLHCSFYSTSIMFNYSVLSYLHKRNEEFGKLLPGLKQ